MDSIVKPIEQALLPIFKGLPALPENGKKALVRYWPILALVFGVLQIFAVLALWNLGHTVSAYLSVVSAYGATHMPSLGFFYYFGLAVLAIDAVILLVAYSPLKARSKKGWDLLFLGALINLVYGFDKLLGSLVGSAIAFYFLFQVRDYYTGAAKETAARPAVASAPRKTS
jgi:hypothetical protein